MSRFDVCLEFVLAWEGGYVNHPNDRGGATNRGVTQKVYDEYRTSNGFGRQPVSGIDPDELLDIYRRGYWLPVHGDDLAEPVDLVMFDTAVNCGPKQATRFLQRALGIPDDGVFGPVTQSRSKTCAYPSQDLASRIIDQRDNFYDALIRNDSRQAVFAKGWERRLDALREYIK